jgi:hypothetical protein
VSEHIETVGLCRFDLLIPTSPSSLMRSINKLFVFNRFWSHPPGSNRRPADYETTWEAQITENTADGPPSRAPSTGITAVVEQVSEQVAGKIQRSCRAALRERCWPLRFPRAPLPSEVYQKRRGSDSGSFILAGQPNEIGPARPADNAKTSDLNWNHPEVG